MGLWAKCWMGDWTKHMAPDTWPTSGKWGIPENGFQKCLFQVASAVLIGGSMGDTRRNCNTFHSWNLPFMGRTRMNFTVRTFHSSPGRWIVCELQCWKKLPAPPNKIHVVRLCENHKMASVRYWWIFEDVRYRWRCENLRYWWNCGDCVCVEMPPVDFACTRPRSAGGKIGYSFPL